MVRSSDWIAFHFCCNNLEELSAWKLLQHGVFQYEIFWDIFFTPFVIDLAREFSKWVLNACKLIGRTQNDPKILPGRNLKLISDTFSNQFPKRFSIPNFLAKNGHFLQICSKYSCFWYYCLGLFNFLRIDLENWVRKWRHIFRHLSLDIFMYGLHG